MTKRRILILLSIILLVLASIPFIAYSVLKSPSMQSKIVASMREPLAKEGITFESSEVSVDLLAGVNFEKLKLTVLRPPLIKAEIAIDHLRFSYSFWALIKKRLELQEAEIRGLKAQIEATLTESNEIKEDQPMTLEQILGLLRSPPIQVSIPAITIRDTFVKLKLIQGTRQTDVELREADLRLAATVKPGVIDLDLTSSISLGLDLKSEGSHVLSSDGNHPPSSKINLKNLSIKPNVRLHLEAPTGELNWRADINADPLKFDGLTISSKDSKGQDIQVELKALNISPRVTLERKGPISNHDQMAALAANLTGVGSQKIELRELKFERRDSASREYLLTVFDALKIANEFSLGMEKDHKPEQMSWDLANVIRLDGLQVKLSPGESTSKNTPKDPAKKPLNISIAGMTLDLNTSAQRGPGELGLKINLNHVKTDALESLVNLGVSANLAFNILESTWKGVAGVVLNESKILSWQGAGADHKGTLTQDSRIDLSIPKNLATIHKALAGLNAAGWPSIQLNIKNEVQHSTAWAEFKPDMWPSLGINGDIHASIKPTVNHFPEGSPSFKELLSTVKISMPARGEGQKESALRSDIKLGVKDLGHPALKRPVEAEISTNVDVRLSDRIFGKIDIDAALEKIKVATIQTAWTDESKIFGIENKISAEITPPLLALLNGASSVPPLGTIAMRGHHQIRLNHGATKLLANKNLDINKMKVDVVLDERVEQDAQGVKNLRVKLDQPIMVALKLALDQGQVKLKGLISADKVSLPETLAVNGLSINLNGVLSDLTTKKSAAFSADGSAANIEALLKDKLDQKVDKIIRNLKFGLAARLVDNTNIFVDKIEAGLQDNLFNFSGAGEFNTIGRGQLDAKLVSKLSPSTQFISGSGRFEMPIKFILLDKTRFSLDSTPKFTNYSLVFGDLSLQNLDGTIKISEELKKDENSKIRFLYLKSQNPFARVDYENLDPFVGERSQLRFDRLTWKHLNVGPLVANLELQQNLILLNDLKVELLGGSALGRFFLDLNPQTPKMGVLGRFSNIQPELLKAPESRTPQNDLAIVAGRAALNFDVRKRLASGRVDLTTLGKRQLLSLLDVLDPNYKDEQIGMARQALRVAYPKFANVALDQGLMDLTVGLGGAISQDLQIRSLPLSNLINSNAGEAISKVETILN